MLGLLFAINAGIVIAKVNVVMSFVNLAAKCIIMFICVKHVQTRSEYFDLLYTN